MDDRLRLIDKLLASTTSGTGPERLAAARRARQLLLRHRPVFLLDAGTLVRVAVAPAKASAPQPLRVPLRLDYAQLRDDAPLGEGLLAFNVRNGILFVPANRVRLSPSMVG